MYTTLQEARKHLNIDEFFTEDDGYIVELIRAAESATEMRIGRPLAAYADPYTGRLDPAVGHAVLLLVGTWYSQREATSPQQVREVPMAYNFLIDLVRKPVLG